MTTKQKRFRRLRMFAPFFVLVLRTSRREVW